MPKITTFAERLRQAIDSSPLSKSDLSKLTGLSKSTITRYCQGSFEAKQDAIYLLSKTLDVSEAWLMGYDVPKLRNTDSDSPSPTPEPSNISPITLSRKVRRINVLGSVPAGVPTEAVEDIIDWEELPEEMFSGGREYFGLRVAGDSMFPDILDGDVVIIRKTPVCNSGNVAVVYVNGYDATLKQVKFSDDGSITLQPRNPNYPPRTYTPEEIAELPVTIAGVVVELRRKWNY